MILGHPDPDKIHIDAREVRDRMKSVAGLLTEGRVDCSRRERDLIDSNGAHGLGTSGDSVYVEMRRTHLSNLFIQRVDRILRNQRGFTNLGWN